MWIQFSAKSMGVFEMMNFIKWDTFIILLHNKLFHVMCYLSHILPLIWHYNDLTNIFILLILIFSKNLFLSLFFMFQLCWEILPTSLWYSFRMLLFPHMIRQFQSSLLKYVHKYSALFILTISNHAENSQKNENP